MIFIHAQSPVILTCLKYTCILCSFISDNLVVSSCICMFTLVSM